MSVRPPNSALLTDAFQSALRASFGAQTADVIAAAGVP